MKKILILLCGLLVLTGCKKDPAPEPEPDYVVSPLLPFSGIAWDMNEGELKNKFIENGYTYLGEDSRYQLYRKGTEDNIWGYSYKNYKLRGLSYDYLGSSADATVKKNELISKFGLTLESQDSRINVYTANNNKRVVKMNYWKEYPYYILDTYPAWISLFIYKPDNE